MEAFYTILVIFAICLRDKTKFSNARTLMRNTQEK